MDHSPIASPRAGRRIALAASVAAHTLVAGLWLQTSPHKTHKPAPERVSVAMTLRLYNAPQQAPTPLGTVEALPAPTPPAPARAARARVRAVLAPAPSRPPEVEAPLPAIAPPIAPSDPAPVPAAAPGAAFAGMFTPIISRPIGGSAWGRRRADPPPAPDPQLQREQALLALRMSLLGRLNDLAGRLGNDGQGLRCTIAIDGAHHTAEVQCADPADQGAPWSALQGLLVAGTVAATNADLCFTLVGTQVSSEPCAADTPVPASPDGVKSSEHRGSGFAGPLVLPP